MLRWQSALSQLLVLTLMSGCGGPDGPARYPVSGTVTVNGEPLEDGSIQFIPSDNSDSPSIGATITGGTYSIPAKKGALAGEYTVQIKGMKKTGRQIEAGSPLPPGTMVDELIEVVPPKYNTNSTLTATIVEGDNENVKFDLENDALKD